MKKEDMYSAVSDLDPDILDKADAYIAKNYKTKTTHRKRWIAAAACFCLLAAGSVSLIPGKEAVSPFAITAYAMEADGEMTGTPMELDQTASMTKIELPGGIGGFLFSVDLDDKDAESSVYDMSINPAAYEYLGELRSITEEKGKEYFYFIPDETEDADGSIVGVTVISTKLDGSAVAYIIQLKNNGGNYIAHLTDVKEYPNGTGDMSDDPLYIDSNSRVFVRTGSDDDR